MLNGNHPSQLHSGNLKLNNNPIDNEEDENSTDEF